MRRSFVARILSLACALCVWICGRTPVAVSAGSDPGVLAGSVADPTGAMVPGATVHLRPAEKRHAEPAPQDLRTDANGSFRVEVAPGRYVLEVEAPGFARYTSKTLAVATKDRVRLAIRLPVATLEQEISVLQDRTDATDPDSTAASLVFEGEGLNFLSNDSATLKQQLTAIAGGMGTPHFLIDGFSGGSLPPKASIRSIRLSQNAFSAIYSEYGTSRVAIDTKPGTDTLHGRAFFSGTDQPLNARNPYSPIAPPFYEFQNEGNLNGPLGRKTAFFVSEDLDQLANNAVVNATDPTNPDAQISTSAPNPQLTQTYSLRLDRQFSPHHFGYLRDEWSRVHLRNSGIQPLILPEAAFTSNTLTETLQMADTQVLGPHAVNEARFQYLRTRLSQTPNSGLPSLVVQGAFQAGGNPGQSSQDNQDSFEGQDRLEFDRGSHSLRLGLRFRSVRDANRSDAGFNGQYIFPDVLSFQAGRASQYSQTVGQQSSVLLNSDVGIYAEDDWKATPHFTLSYGMRFESQTALPDTTDLPLARAS